MEIPLEASETKWISLGDEVIIKDENNVYEWNSKVIRKAENVNEQTQSISVYVSIINNGKPIYKGQYLKATFLGIPLTNVMEMPRNAVLIQTRFLLFKIAY
ncbi:MAG: hypothetical protein H6613_07330 [Ignavibacteriales bacterium]|nr:hypothetical protein [Ignavibacteriales bacterium]